MCPLLCWLSVLHIVMLVYKTCIKSPLTAAAAPCSWRRDAMCSESARIEADHAFSLECSLWQLCWHVELRKEVLFLLELSHNATKQVAVKIKGRWDEEGGRGRGFQVQSCRQKRFSERIYFLTCRCFKFRSRFCSLKAFRAAWRL